MSILELDIEKKAGHAPVALAEENGRKFEYPGMPTTCDGAEAVVHVEIQICPGGRRVSDHQLDHDGRRLQRRRHERRQEPVGRSR